MAAFLTDNGRKSSEIVTKDVLDDLRDLQMTSKKPKECNK
jgi:hypothetical protein